MGLHWLKKNKSHLQPIVRVVQLTMEHGFHMRLFSALLLLYTLLYIVPPISSFASDSEALMDTSEEYSYRQDHRMTWLYLLDIILWRSLKEVRHSEEILVMDWDHKKLDSPEVLEMPLLTIPPAQKMRLDGYSRTARRPIFTGLSRLSDISFARSGISPPFLS